MAGGGAAARRGGTPEPSATRYLEAHTAYPVAADAAVLPRGSVWAEILEDELGWRPVYLDSVAGVWVGRGEVPGGIEPP